MVTINTNFGPIKIKLDFENTPITANNFLDYIKSGFYDGTIFHRVIDGFMIQGGGFEPGMRQKTTNTPIKNEADHAEPNKRGTIAMARTSDPDSATSQFFINIRDNNFLNFSNKTPDGWGYCVFASVVEGLDIVDAMRKIETTSQHGHDDVPVEDIIIEKVTIEE